MTPANLLQLSLLAAIWGAAFLLLRISVPSFGPAMLIELRLGLAAAFLFVVARLLGKPLEVKKYWRQYLIIGLFNAALPFLLFAYAAINLNVSLLTILNATAPIFGALVAAVWLREPLSRRMIAGMLLGLLGVAILAGYDDSARLSSAAIAAALGAALCYGIASNYAKSTMKQIEPLPSTHGSMWAATLIVAPILPFFPVAHTPTAGVWAAAVVLGVLCTGVAFLLYFKLIENIGATSALTVTFLIPVFGVLWGALFLGEQPGWHTLIGSLAVFAGTALVSGLLPRRLVAQEVAR